MRVFYGAGHEQFTPSELLGHARLAEEGAIRIYGQRVLPRLVA